MSEMNGFFSLRTVGDLLEKLEADFKRLSNADQSSIEAQYAAFDFFVCAEHIPDWLKETIGGTKTSHRSYADGPLVSHIANGAKHFRVDVSRHTAVRDTAAWGGAFQGDAFQSSAFDVSRLVVEREDGTVADVLDVALKVVEHWRKTLA